MKMKIKTVIMLVLILALPLMLMAQQGPHGKGFCDSGPKWSHFDKAQKHFGAARGQFGQKHGQFMQSGRMHRMLDLTDEQRDQVDQMAEAFQLAQIDRKAELKKAQIRLKNSARGGEASEREVFRLIDDVSSLKAEMHKARYSHRQEFKALLTDEQLEKLKELRSGRHGEVEVEYFFESDDDDDGERESYRELRRKKVIRGGGHGRI